MVHIGSLIILSLPVILNVFTSGTPTCYSSLFLKGNNFPEILGISLCKANTLEMPQFRQERIEIPQKNLDSSESLAHMVSLQADFIFS